MPSDTMTGDSSTWTVGLNLQNDESIKAPATPLPKEFSFHLTGDYTGLASGGSSLAPNKFVVTI